MAQPLTGNPAFFGIKVSKLGTNVTQAGPKDLVYENDYTTETYYDSSNSRILIGQLPDSSYGIQVSEPGVDVTTATPAQLVIDSNQPPFKIAQQGLIEFNVVVPTVPGSNFVQLAHGLGYAPFVQAFVDQGTPLSDPVQWSPIPWSQSQEFTIANFPSGSVDTILNFTRIDISVDNTNIYLFATTTNVTVAAIYPVQYFLLTTTL